VMDFQRKRTYGTRQAILDGRNPRAILLEMLDEQILAAVKRYSDDNYGPASFAQYAGGEFGIEFDPADFKGANYEEAVKLAQDLEFPVQVGLAAYQPEKVRADRRPDRDGLFRWAIQRFPGSAGTISEELVRTETRSKIREALLEVGRQFAPAADYPEFDAKL